MWPTAFDIAVSSNERGIQGWFIYNDEIYFREGSSLEIVQLNLDLARESFGSPRIICGTCDETFTNNF